MSYKSKSHKAIYRGVILYKVRQIKAEATPKKCAYVTIKRLRSVHLNPRNITLVKKKQQQQKQKNKTRKDKCEV